MTFGTIEYRNVLCLVIDLIHFVASWRRFDILGVIVARVLPVIVVRFLQHRPSSPAEILGVARVSTCGPFLDGEEILPVASHDITHAAVRALVADWNRRIAILSLLQASMVPRKHRLELIQIFVNGSVPTIYILKLMLRDDLAVAPLLRVFAHLSWSLLERGLAELLDLESENHAAERHPVLMVRHRWNKRRCFRHVLIIRVLLVFGLVSFLVALIVESVVEVLGLPWLFTILSQD